jgi:histidinol phosphatase-like PHP family hydrolase
MHSTWSDGSQTLEDIIETGIKLGYQFCAVTDHSYGLKIAGGVSMASLAGATPGDRPAQHEASRDVSSAQRHRSEHPRRRHDRHGAE